MIPIFSPESYRFLPDNYFFWAAIVNVLAAAICGPLVLSRNPTDKRNQGLFIFTLAVFLWAVSYALWQISARADVALFWTRGLMVAAIFAPILMLNLHIRLLNLRARWVRPLLASLLIFFLACLVADFTPWFVRGVEPEAFFPFWPKPGILFHLYLVVWLATLAFAYAILFIGWRKAVGIQRRQFAIILIGDVITLVSGATNYFLWYGIRIIPWATALVASYSVATAYAMIRYRLFEITPSMAGEAVIKTVPDALIVTGLDGTIWIANPAAEHLLKRGLKSLRGRPISEIVTESRRLLETAEAKAGLADGGRIIEDLSLLTRDGESIPVSISLGTVSAEGSSGYVFICHDVRLLKERMQLLTQQRDELQLIKQDLETANLQLNDKVGELNRLTSLMTGRETQMIVLKERIRKLEKKA